METLALTAPKVKFNSSISLSGHIKGPITWAGLARCTEMTAQPGITRGEPARLRLNLEAVVWKDGYIKEHELSVFTFANPLFWCIIFSFM